MQSHSLPCPEFSICVDLPAATCEPIDFGDLPAKSGVFIFEDANGGTLALATTANLRRMVAHKLEAIADASKPTRRVDYRSLTGKVRAIRVGSAFEGDWAYLQIARLRLAATYRGLLDRWQAWFVQCNPDAAFPQLVKTVRPAAGKTGDVFLGPFPDKHAAGRYIEMLQNAFDLCRYHHILVQAPNATACAYKEMGRCPAPCDGSITMDQYREQIRAAIEFASTPIDHWRGTIESAMRQAGEQLDFEAAQLNRELLERTAIATRAEFAQVDRLERFAYLAVMPSTQKSCARIFLIRGGWIEPMADVPIASNDAELDVLLGNILERAKPQAADFSLDAIENIALVCWHLFRPRTAKSVGIFLRLNQELDRQRLASSLRQVERNHQSRPEDEAVSEMDIDNLISQ